jgi:hypothetical protein
MPSINDHLRNLPQPDAPRQGPLWKGPEVDGVTFTLLSRFLVCRERFRLLVIEGLRPSEGFNHRIEYGNMWHLCEEHHARGNDPTRGNKADKAMPLWEGALKEYATALAKRYPIQREQVEHWWNVCRTQFPVYVHYWARNTDVVQRIPLLQEYAFKVPYQLPSGRTVLLRGKWDSVDVIGKGKGTGIYLQENKTKGDVVEAQLKRQLTFDLQTMLYLVALENQLEFQGQTDLRLPPGVAGSTLGGVRYNVIRRPLSGGKYSIVRHKPSKSNMYGESPEEYYARLGSLIKENPEHFFMRWRVEVQPEDIARFRKRCLDPILEQLCDWWEWVRLTPHGDPFSDRDGSFGEPEPNHIHWQHPFGVYNVLDEGGSTDLDEYLSSGSLAGLTRTDNLFPEL